MFLNGLISVRSDGQLLDGQNEKRRRDVGSLRRSGHSGPPSARNALDFSGHMAQHDAFHVLSETRSMQCHKPKSDSTNVKKPELAAVLGAERFVVEIKTTAALQHPHLLPLFDSGTADGDRLPVLWSLGRLGPELDHRIRLGRLVARRARPHQLPALHPVDEVRRHLYAFADHARVRADLDRDAVT